MADHDALMGACGRIVSGLHLLAGRPDLARRIRISLPRKGTGSDRPADGLDRRHHPSDVGEEVAEVEVEDVADQDVDDRLPVLRVGAQKAGEVEALAVEGVDQLAERRHADPELALVNPQPRLLVPMTAGLPGGSVRAIHRDARGILLVGTEDRGLHRLEAAADGPPSGPETGIDRRHGLWDDSIHQILEDGAGWLWMSNRRGIFRVRRSRLEDLIAGRIERVDPVVYLAALLADLAERFQGLAERRGLRFRNLPPPGPVPVWGDPGQLEKVFANLLSNAMRYTPEDGRVEMTVEEREGTAAGGPPQPAPRAAAPAHRLPAAGADHRAPLEAGGGAARGTGGLGVGGRLRRRLRQRLPLLTPLQGALREVAVGLAAGQRCLSRPRPAIPARRAPADPTPPRYGSSPSRAPAAPGECASGL